MADQAATAVAFAASALPPLGAPTNQPTAVAGSKMMDEAKIGGITPDMFSLSGRCEDWPPYTLLPTWRFA